MGLLGRGKRDTNWVGEITEAAITTRFLQLGYVVLTSTLYIFGREGDQDPTVVR